MSILSLAFIIFLAAVVLVYYIVPKKCQWGVLLIASCIFYLLLSAKGAVFVVVTATTIYFATCNMQRLLEEQKVYIKENKATLSKDEKKVYKALKQKGKG